MHSSPNTKNSIPILQFLFDIALFPCDIVQFLFEILQFPAVYFPTQVNIRDGRFQVQSIRFFDSELYSYRMKSWNRLKRFRIKPHPRHAL